MPYTRFFYSLIGTAGILLAVMFTVPDAYAQTAVTCPEGGRKIQLMVGVPGLAEDSCARSLPQIINQFYLFLITIGAIVGVVKIGIAGFKYATSDIVSSKSEAKQDIQGVFLGLIILLIPFLVLNAISPNAANLDVLKLERIGGTEGTGSFNAAQNQQGPSSPPEMCFELLSPAPILMSSTTDEELLVFKRACEANDGVTRSRRQPAGVEVYCCDLIRPN